MIRAATYETIRKWPPQQNLWVIPAIEPENVGLTSKDGGWIDQVQFSARRLAIIGGNTEAACEGLIPRSQATLQQPTGLLETHQVHARWPAVRARQDKTSDPRPIADRLAILE